MQEQFLAWLKVPPEPTPPAGSPGSLRVFRAGRNYLRFRLIVWAGAQIGAILGIFASLMFVEEIELQIELRTIAEIQASSAPGGEVSGWDAEAEAERMRGPVHRSLYRIAPPWLRQIPKQIPEMALPWILLGEFFGLFGFVLQFVWSLVAVWLDYGLRWYMVTDRSLRLRWGVLSIQESTMSFANLQQVTVKQGPLQRLLKLADVEVRSAGGGSGKTEHGEDDSMHRSLFHAVDNASEIRDLILSRLQRFRQAGLGDPDDAHDDEAGADRALAPAGDATAIEAARTLLQELRDWRASLRG
jgi:membrane protein YdbS with pleckstrin-like domain